jgi:ABC-type hemin transport system ATPase subunit
MKGGRMIAFGAPEQVLTRDTITEAFAGAATSHPVGDGTPVLSPALPSSG